MTIALGYEVCVEFQLTKLAETEVVFVDDQLDMSHSNSLIQL